MTYKISMIQIRDLLIQRNGIDALRIDSLDIQRGETLTIVGPNGAGKSTLLLALARLIQPASGEIIYDGKPQTQWDELEYRRKISFVFQSPLLMDMTVEQNVALGLRFRGMLKEETRERVGKWMKQLGVESLSKRRAGQLSGGEAEGVSVARAFVLEPELLLLDEPFSSLDPPTRARMLDAGGRVAARLWTTTDGWEGALRGNYPAHWFMASKDAPLRLTLDDGTVGSAYVTGHSEHDSETTWAIVGVGPRPFD